MNKLIFLIFIISSNWNQFTKEIETPIYIFPKSNCRNSYEKCYRNSPFKWPADKCKGTVCKYKTNFKERFEDPSKTEPVKFLDNLILVKGKGSPEYNQATEMFEHPAKIYGKKIDELSGELIWIEEGLKGALKVNFKNAVVIQVDRVEYYTREECECE